MAERKSRGEDSAKASGEQDTKASEERTGEPAREARAPKAAPIQPPQAKKEPEPEPEPVSAPNAVVPNRPYNDDSTRLLDDEGKLCTPEECLDYPGPDDPRILIIVTKRIFREYRHPHTTTKVTKLLYPAGALITKAAAAELKAEMNQDRQAEQDEQAS